MSDLSRELQETFSILYQNAIALNELRVKRAVEEFDPKEPLVDKGLDEEYIKKHLEK